MNNVKIFTTLLTLILSTSVHAQFSNSASVAYEQGVQQKDGSQAKSLGFVYIPSYKINDFKFSGRFIYGYDLVNPANDSDWVDGVFNASTSKLKIFEAVKTTPSVGFELPFSKESRENRGINYVLTTGLNLALDTKYLEMENFNLSYGITYGYFQNDYTTRANGEPTTQYKIIQSLVTGYNFNPISIEFVFQFASNNSYDNVFRNSFLHIETITYTLNDTLGFSLYHYNKGSLLKAKTYENNLKAFDEESSTFGLSMDLSF